MASLLLCVLYCCTPVFGAPQLQVEKDCRPVATYAMIGRLPACGCPLTLRGSRTHRRWLSTAPDLVLEPSACVDPSDLSDACSQKPAFNYVQAKYFFRLPIRLHHPTLLDWARGTATTHGSVGQMRVTEVDVSAGISSNPSFTVGDARLTGNGEVATVGVYCRLESECRNLQRNILKEPEYFLEILELRFRATISPGCYQTTTISKKVSLMTGSPGNLTAGECQPSKPSTVRKGGCNEGDSAVTMPAAAKAALAPLLTTFNGPSGLAFFDFRRSCRNLRSAAGGGGGGGGGGGLGAVQLGGDAERLQGAGVQLSGTGAAIAISGMSAVTAAAKLNVFVQYEETNDTRRQGAQYLLMLTNCSDPLRGSWLAVRREVPDGLRVMWRMASNIRTSAAFLVDPPSSRRLRSVGAVFHSGGFLSMPTLFVDGKLVLPTPGTVQSETSDLGVDATERGADCLLLGGDRTSGGLAGTVRCAAVAWGQRAMTESDFKSLESACISAV